MDNNAILIENVTVAYHAKPVLWNVNAAIKMGRMTAIVGPNGAGKSTLLKTILNLVKPISGQVMYSLDGSKFAPYDELKTNIAYVPQNSSVDWDFPTTVHDVVLMGRYGKLGWFKRPSKKDQEIADMMLEKVGMPTFKNRQISQLSGGQRQRVFLARALSQEADIYILDEPLAGVDIKTEAVIINLLKQLVAEGKTVVLVHHDLSTVEQYFDDVVFLNHEIVAYGPVEEAFTEDLIQETYRTDRNLGEGD
ncbi:peptide transporter [Aerococcus urinaehominis]|uniref:Peptide transporter n=1 Tax=Aerococcus urinaehominis TaxID=128944 RepID=A0A0X8FJV2_9LACT|nr:metal ABC transporter ATP-binding protein [Aerococcus urinaehominis]AMB98643.1 peptide transporter [Aerococcus urinaehominis]SDL96627.1 manganese/zinc/iron transport system ATP-binding protein [Aerococcus urinaehominis]